METIEGLLGELIKEAYNCKKHDVFVEYSPHVEWISVRIYLNYWSRDAEKDYEYIIYLNMDDAKMKLKAVICHIKKIGGEQ